MALRQAGLLDAPRPWPAFDRIARIAARVVGAPGAVVALLDADQLILLGSHGLGDSRTAAVHDPALQAICQEINASGGAVVVPDARTDPRVHDRQPSSALQMVACLGVPVVDAEGFTLGALLVVDPGPRAWSDADVEALTDLGAHAGREIEHRLDPGEREQLLVALERQRARIAELFSLAPAFICVLRGPNHVFEFANTRYYQLVGHRDLIGRPAGEVVPEFVSQGFAERANRVLATGEPFIGNGAHVRLERTPGAVPEDRVVNYVFQPVFEPEGYVSGVFVLGVDVTDEARATEALTRRDALLRETERIACVGSWEWDVVSGAVSATEELNRLHDRPTTATPATVDEYLAVVHPDDRNALRAALQRAAAVGEPYALDYRIVRSDGTVRTLHGRGRAETDASGSVVRLLGSGQDVTDRMQLEAQLRQAQRMEAVGRLAGGVAHDFNNLLTVITASTMFARAEVSPRSPAARELDQIDEATRRAAELTRQLLALSRKQVLRPQRLDLGRQVTAVERMLRRVIGTDVRIETSLAPGLWPVSADPGQVEQVLLNLVINARDALPNGGAIRIATANVEIDEAAVRDQPGLTAGEYVSLVVQDTGVGIAPALLPMIFEPFVTTKEPGKGTGLGLPMVYGVVKQSRGHVFAESTPGRGAKFTILLPRDDAVSDPPQAEPTSAAGGHETILLVEDETTVRASLARILTRSGYHVLEAADGDEALHVWHRHAARAPSAPHGPHAAVEAVQLVLTDLVMPNVGGRALVERIRAEAPAAKIIVMTGYAPDADDATATLPDTVATLQKPIRPDELIRAVRECLQRP